MNATSAVSRTELDSFVDRLRPLIDDTIDKLGQASFREDPIGGRKYSRATSIMSSAYKRHGQILDRALLERLKDCARLQVWTEPEFKLSHDSLRALQQSDRIEPLLRTMLPYGDRERSIALDVVVFDTASGALTCYNVKRGNGSYDGGKRRMIQGELLRAHMLLEGYGKSVGLKPASSHAHIVFYYGLLSLPKPLAIGGDELDDHFQFPIKDAIEAANTYFVTRLHNLVEEG